MLVVYEVFHIQKDGNSENEYEDAYYPPNEITNALPFSCCVADGATDASFSGLWASILVKSSLYDDKFRRYIAKRDCRHWISYLNNHRPKWFTDVFSRKLPWFVENKAIGGAFSTFLFISLKPVVNYGAWQSISVGDSNLFQIRNGKCIYSFPISHSTDFSNFPVLVSSIKLRDRETFPLRKHGRFSKNDIFYMMTDALAQWFLRGCELNKSSENETINQVNEISHTSFPLLIERLRNNKQLKNDDVTLIRLRFT